MPVFTNISDVLMHIGTDDVRFMPISLPYGFNHWSAGKAQLIEDNAEFFLKKKIVLDCDAQVGVLTTEGGNARGWMVILEGSRYVCTDWVKRLATPQHIQHPDLLGVHVRRAMKGMYA
jgi:hypothetical protein